MVAIWFVYFFLNFNILERHWGMAAHCVLRALTGVYVFHKYSNVSYTHARSRGFGNQWELSLSLGIYIAQYIDVRFTRWHAVWWFRFMLINWSSLFFKFFQSFYSIYIICYRTLLAFVLNNHLISAHNIAYKKEPIIGFSNWWITHDHRQRKRDGGYLLLYYSRPK